MFEVDAETLRHLNAEMKRLCEPNLQLRNSRDLERVGMLAQFKRYKNTFFSIRNEEIYIKLAVGCGLNQKPNHMELSYLKNTYLHITGSRPSNKGLRSGVLGQSDTTGTFAVTYCYLLTVTRLDSITKNTYFFSRELPPIINSISFSISPFSCWLSSRSNILNGVENTDILVVITVRVLFWPILKLCKQMLQKELKEICSCSLRYKVFGLPFEWIYMYACFIISKFRFQAYFFIFLFGENRCTFSILTQLNITLII